MNTQIKRFISAFLAVCLLCLSAPLSGFTEISFFTTARAYSTGSLIEYGTYPQSRVTNTGLISKLEAAPKGWKSYNYYSGTGSEDDGKMTPSNFMTFADFFCEGKKYRAVAFLSYRPSNTGYTHSAANSYQDDNGYYANNTYYFLYEPITWRVLDPGDGLIMSELLLDAQSFQNTMYRAGDDCWQDASRKVYASDYAASSIRSWLNNDFFETAFTDAQKANIRSDVLQENPSTWDSRYNAASTMDKVFLLSYFDMRNSAYGFDHTDDEPDPARQAKGTDYAKAQGLHVCSRVNGSGNSWWWQRCPDWSNLAHTIEEEGFLQSSEQVNETCGGVRAACRLSELRSDTQVSQTLFSGDASSVEGEIMVFSTERSLSVETGQSMWLAFGLGTPGEDLNWIKMSLTLSDNSVASVSEFKKNPYGFAVTVTGKKQGETNLTVVDAQTGKNKIITIRVYNRYAQTHSYDIMQMPSFYPTHIGDTHILTNIHDQDGIYINNYTCRHQNGKYKVSLDAYNARYYYGAIDIFDADGNWLGSKAIDKNSNVGSIYEEGESIYYLTTDSVNGKLFSYEQQSFSKKTENIEFEVPDGGYFTVSNNMTASIGTFLYNGFDIIFTAAIRCAELATTDTLDITSFDRLFTGVFEEDPSLREAMWESFKDSAFDAIKDFSKDVRNNNIENACENFAAFFQSFLKAISDRFDLKTLFETFVGYGESVFEALAGPAGIGLHGLFKFIKGSSELMQAVQIAQSTDNTYATVYSSVDEGFIASNGVVVNTQGNMDAEAVLQVFRVCSDTSLPPTVDPDDPSVRYEVYNICFVKDDQTVGPRGKVTVMIPVPAGMNNNTCTVYRQEEDGSWTALRTRREGDFLVFETDHFSMYAVVGASASITVLHSPYKVSYSLGESLDTAGLILSVNGEEITQGYICSPTVFTVPGEQTVTVTFGHTHAEFTVRVSSEHMHDTGYWVTVKAASCTEAGKKELHCGVCGAVLRTENITATGHDWGEWAVQVSPTCMFEGTAVRVCANDPSHTEYMSLDKISHFDADGNGYCDMCCNYLKQTPMLLKLGDTDNDGSITAADARTALRIAVSLERYAKTDRVYISADADEDGTVTAADARLILRASVGLEYLVQGANTVLIASAPTYDVILISVDDTDGDVVLHLKLTNKTDKRITFDFNNFAVNSYMLDKWFSSDVIAPHGSTEGFAVLNVGMHAYGYQLTPAGEIRWDYTVYEQDPDDYYIFSSFDRGHVNLYSAQYGNVYKYVPSFSDDVYFMITPYFKLAYAQSDVGIDDYNDPYLWLWLFAYNTSDATLEYEFELKRINGRTVPENWCYYTFFNVFDDCSRLMKLDLYYSMDADWPCLLNVMDLYPTEVETVEFAITVRNVDSNEIVCYDVFSLQNLI